MTGVRDYQQLDVWKLANEVRARVAKLTARHSFRDHLWLRTQLRKAANSACANTGEGFARYKPKVFEHFLDIVKGSLAEVCEHLNDVSRLGLAPSEEIDEIARYARRARGAATNLARYLSTAELPGSTAQPKRTGRKPGA